jgi:putative flippase GtrA
MLFAVVSGVGLIADLSLYLAAINLAGLAPGYANAGGVVAITLVFSVSARFIFEGDGRFPFSKGLVYLAYQALAVAIYSSVIEFLVGHGFASAFLAKVIVTPMSLCTNYLFNRFLLQRRQPSPTS